MGLKLTSLSEDYQRGAWGLPQAVREIISNGLDGAERGQLEDKGALSVDYNPRAQRLTVTNQGVTVPATLGRQSPVVEQLTDLPGEVAGIRGPVEEPGPLAVEQFGKRTVVGRHDRHARGKGLDHGDALGFGEDRRHGEHVDALEEPQLFRAVHLPEPVVSPSHAELCREGQAAAAVVLASDESRRTTGHTIFVDGGITVQMPYAPIIRKMENAGMNRTDQG
jgi:hypothetical protein